MNANEQFDELARRKLEERAFSFEESAWLDAEKAIEANKRKRRGWLPYAAGAAALIALWLLWPAEQEELAQQQGTGTVEIVQPVEKQSTVFGPVAPHDETPAEVARVESNAGSVSASNAPVRPNAPTAKDVRISPSTERYSEEAGTELPSSAAKEQPQKAVVDGDDNSSARDLPLDAAGIEPNIPPDTDLDQGTPTDDLTTAAQDVPATGGPEQTTPSIPPASDSADGGVPPATIDPAPTDGTLDIGIVSTPITAAGSDLQPPPTGTATDPPNDDQLPADPSMNSVADDGITLFDTAAVVVNTPLKAPEDSLPANPEPPSAAPPIVPANAPWEISLLAGAFSSTSRYSGGESAAWSVEREQSTSFGGEFMRMGRNWGVGAGLHYVTYADRLSTPESKTTSITYDPFWYLQAIDTTILIVTGSFLDSLGNVVYTGVNVNTTVQVLRSSVDTISTTTVLREARERVNRTSYFEVPFLFDAHLVQGRWSFGLRAGPSIGLLTMRQGDLPNEADNTDTDLSEMLLREYVWGYTARGYVRYRFSNAWSVGLEPAIRGQLQDAFEKQPYTRQSNAFGCMLSVSYRLP